MYLYQLDEITTETRYIFLKHASLSKKCDINNDSLIKHRTSVCMHVNKGWVGGGGSWSGRKASSLVPGRGNSLPDGYDDEEDS